MAHRCRECRETFPSEWQLSLHKHVCSGVLTQASIESQDDSQSQPVFSQRETTNPSKKKSPTTGAPQFKPSVQPRNQENAPSRRLSTAPRPQATAQSPPEIGPMIDLSRIAKRGKRASKGGASSTQLASTPSHHKKKEGSSFQHRVRMSPKEPERRPGSSLPPASRTVRPRPQRTPKRPVNNPSRGNIPSQSSNVATSQQKTATSNRAHRTSNNDDDSQDEDSSGSSSSSAAGGIISQRVNLSDDEGQNSRYSITPKKVNSRQATISSYGLSLFGSPGSRSPPQALITPTRPAAAAATLANASRDQQEWVPTQIIDLPDDDYVEPKTHVPTLATTTQQAKSQKAQQSTATSTTAKRAGNTRDGRGKELHGSEGGIVLVEDTPPGPAHTRQQSLKGSSTAKIQGGIGHKPPAKPKGLSPNDMHIEEDSNESSSSEEDVPLAMEDGPNPSSDIFHHPLLTTYGLVINVEWRLFICTTCKQAQTTSNLRNHLASTDKHPFKVDAATFGKILEIGSNHRVRSEYPHIDGSQGPLTAVVGLPINIRSGCPFCDHVGIERHVRSHVREHHTKEKVPLHSNVPCQVLNPGACPRAFRVLPPVVTRQAQSIHEALVEEFRQFTPYTTNISDPPLHDLRLVAPWVQRAGFYRCTQGRDVSKCRALVALPQPHEIQLDTLGKVVLELLDETSHLIAKTDPFVLQLLNTSEPEAGTNHTPFRMFQEHTTTIRAYAQPITHLIAALVRRGFDDFRLPTNDRVVKALSQLDQGITTEAIHELLLSIWTHQWTWTEEEPYCDPTICFLSMFTLQRDGTFAQAKDVTGIIAKLSRAIRLTVLREIHCKVKSGEEKTLLAAFGPFQKFIVESSQSTFQTLQYYQHYASSLAFQTMSMPNIVFPKRLVGNMEVMIYRGQRIDVTQIKEIMSDLEQDIIGKLKNDVLLGLDAHVDLGTPVDRLQSTERGYSFITDSSNLFHQSTDSLGAYILQDEKLRNEFIQTIPGTTTPVWNVPRARQWLQALADLEGLLLLSVEMKSGAPMRLTELTSTLACNIDTRTRNLYAFGRDILICTQYNKNTNNEQADRLIPHALAAFDADVLVQIHTLARPFAQFLASKVYPEQTDLPRAYKERLFMNHAKPFTSRDTSRMLGERTQAKTGTAFTISDWRQMAIGYKNVLCTPSEVDDDDLRIFQSFQAQQSGHSVATERRIYALTPGDLEGLSRTTIQIYVNVSVEWQTRFGIVPSGHALPYWEATMKHFDGLVAAGSVKLLPGRHEKRTGENSADIVMAIQQMSMKQVESNNRVLVELAKLREEVRSITSRVPVPTPNNDDQFDPPHDDLRSVSHHSPPPLAIAHHVPAPVLPQTPEPPFNPSPPQSDQQQRDPPISRLAGPSVTSSSKRKRDESSMEGMSRTQPAKIHIVAAGGHPPNRDSDMLLHLRHLFGPRANWTHPGQRLAVEKALQHERDLIVILRTGIGKSAIALLPPQVEQAITVLVIPLVILLEDWKRRLEAMGIAYEEFDPAEPDTSLTGATNIILVSADKATYTSFKAALARVNEEVPVVRMIVDEAHIWFTDRTFRKEALSAPSALRIFPMQVVLLSATIPPAAEPFLKRAFGMVNGEVIRGLSHRPELEYDVFLRADKWQDMVKYFQYYITELKSQIEWSPESRWIAYVGSIEMGEYLAGVLGVQFYQGSDHPDKKRETYDSWHDGIYEGIIATSALAAGTDYPHVRLTCHFGDPYDMVLFVQQSSRAGRDHQPARCLIISSNRSQESTDTPDMRGHSAMQQTLYGLNDNPGYLPCVRRMIGESIDGQSYSCIDFDSNWAACYICKQRFEDMNVIEYTGAALPQVEPSLVLPLLSPPPLLDRPTLALRLKESFDRSVKHGQKQAAAVLAQKTSETEKYSVVLKAVGHNCGACLMQGRYDVHGPKECPVLAKNISAYYDIVNKVDYKRKYVHKPCWRCHVASWGSDTLHRAYVSSNKPASCDNPNFLKPLVAEVWNNPGVREKVRAWFKADWNTREEYVEWLGTPDPVHSTKSMGLIVWFGEMYNPAGVVAT